MGYTDSTSNATRLELASTPRSMGSSVRDPDTNGVMRDEVIPKHCT